MRGNNIKVEETELVDVTFYKPTGKYYTSCRIELPLYLSSEGYKQAIVDKQTCLEDGWQNSDSAWMVSTSAKHNADYKGFHEHVWLPFAFKGIEKTRLAGGFF